MTADPARALVKEAAKAGWNACRKSIYAICEDMQERPFAGGGPLRGVETPTQEAHGKGFNAGWKHAGKSMARAMGALEAEDDDNFRATLQSIKDADHERD